MKHLILLLALTCVCSALRAQTDPAAPPKAEPSNPPANTVPPNAETPAPGAAPVEAPVPTPEAATETTPPAEGATNGLRLNFRGVPLDAVLEYLSDAAGFIIVKEARVRGTVDVWSNQPLTRDEAVNLLNTVLKKNGFAAIRNGRTLTIVNRDEAKTHDIPVISGGDPAQIPRTDEIVTQIIPVRFVEVTQLVKDLQPLVSQQSTITANEAGNAIVMTDTQANIRRVAEIIRAIDAGAEEFTEVRVFRLTNSDPVETADLLSNLFPDDTSRSGGGSQSPFQGFGGRFLSRFGGGGPGGGGGGGNNNASNAQNQRIKKRNRVIAVADQRTASLVVSATRDLMEQIAVVIDDLDQNRKGRQTVKIYKLENADPQEALPVLQDLFQKNTTQNSRNGNNQNSALINRSTTQNNQNNSGTRNGTMTPNNRGGAVGGGGGFQ